MKVAVVVMPSAYLGCICTCQGVSICTVPNAPKTPNRAIRVDDDLWRAAQLKAGERGESVSEVIRRALRRYVAKRG